MRKKRSGYFTKHGKSFNYLKLFAACFLFTFSANHLAAKSPDNASVKEVQQSGVTITGKVVDGNGEEVIGASIGIKGTTKGTVSDLDGAFTLANVPSDGTLVISYLSFKTQEIKINGRTTFNIVMEDDATALGPVVVEVGYGAVKRENLLGAVGSLSTEGIKDIPTANLSETLYGKVAGVGLSINHGTPGTAPSIKVRNVSSYTSGAQSPLFVIDGVVREDQAYFDILDPNDVESISVLKDASAAVYGARGAGGVIVVKTKMGKEGKAKLSYSGSFGISDRTSFPELMSSEELLTFLNDARDTEYERNTLKYMSWDRDQFRSSAPTIYNPAENVDNRGYYYTAEEFAAVKGRNYNWLDKYWSSAITTKHNVNLSGGTKDVKYFTGLSYFQQEGNISDLNVEQYSFRVGVEAKLVAGLTGKFSVDTNTKTKRMPYNRNDSSDGTMKSTFQSLMRTPRWMPYEVDGYLTTFNDGVNAKLPEASSGNISHVAAIGDSYNKTKGTNTTINIGFDYDFSDINDLFKGLRAKASYARTETSSHQRQYRQNYLLYQLAQITPGAKIPSENEFAYNTDGTIQSVEIPNGDRIAFNTSRSRYHQFNIGLDYARKFGLHNLNVMFNYEESESKGDGFNMFREGMTVFDWEMLNAFQNAIEGGNSYSRGGRRGYIGRLNYDYDDRYLLETSFRYESSNRFPKDARWGFFPSVALGWRISEEDWYNVSFMDNAKLRISTGLVGDDKAISNQWTYNYSAVDGAYLGGGLLTNGLRPTLSGTKQSKLKWETTFYQNYGVDLRFFGKFDLGFDFWHKNTWDILDASTSDYPQTVGVNKGPARNYGRMRSWGYELSLSYNGRINSDMTYRIGANLSWSDSEIGKLIQDQSNVGTWLDRQGRRADTGIEGYNCLGIIRTEEQLQELLDKNPDYKIFDKPAQLGMLYYEDVNGDGNITQADRMRLKERSTNPYAMGINLGFTWKTLNFSAQFTGGFGGWTLMNKNDYAYPTASANGLSMWADHWTLENPNASMPRASTSSYDDLQPSNFWLKRGTELRLRNVSVSYAFPKTISNKVGMSDLRLYLTATNLFTLVSPYDYKDPSLSYFDSYPIMRTISLGLNVSF